MCAFLYTDSADAPLSATTNMILTLIKKYIVRIIVALVIIALILFLASLLRHYKSECDRLRNNVDALTTECETYKTECCKSAVSVKTLTLTVDELKETERTLTKKVRDLNIRLRRVKNISETTTESSVTLNGKTELVAVNITDTLRCSDYEDPYVSLQYCYDSECTYTADVTFRDTVTAVVHRVPRKFLFFRFGTKEIRQEVTCASPYTTIVTSTHIDMVR